MDSMSFHVSVKALVADVEGRLLLLQEDNGLWDLPGGRMEHGEDFAGALVRECREEMGIAGEIVDAAPFLAWSILHSDGFWKVILCFRMILSADALARHWRPSSEGVTFAFHAPEHLDRLELVRQMAPLAERWRSAR